MYEITFFFILRRNGILALKNGLRAKLIQMEIECLNLQVICCLLNFELLVWCNYTQNQNRNTIVLTLQVEAIPTNFLPLKHHESIIMTISVLTPQMNFLCTDKRICHLSIQTLFTTPSNGHPSPLSLISITINIFICVSAIIFSPSPLFMWLIFVCPTSNNVTNTPSPINSS